MEILPLAREEAFPFSSMDTEGEQGHLKKEEKRRKKGANEGTGGGGEIEETNPPFVLPLYKSRLIVSIPFRAVP